MNSTNSSKSRHYVYESTWTPLLDEVLQMMVMSRITTQWSFSNVGHVLSIQGKGVVHLFQRDDPSHLFNPIALSNYGRITWHKDTAVRRYSAIQSHWNMLYHNKLCNYLNQATAFFSLQLPASIIKYWCCKNSIMQYPSPCLKLKMGILWWHRAN